MPCAGRWWPAGHPGQGTRPRDRAFDLRRCQDTPMIPAACPAEPRAKTRIIVRPSHPPIMPANGRLTKEPRWHLERDCSCVSKSRSIQAPPPTPRGHLISSRPPRHTAVRAPLHRHRAPWSACAMAVSRGRRLSPAATCSAAPTHERHPVMIWRQFHDALHPESRRCEQRDHHFRGHPRHRRRPVRLA